MTAKLIRYWSNTFKKHGFNYNNKRMARGALTPKY